MFASNKDRKVLVGFCGVLNWLFFCELEMSRIICKCGLTTLSCKFLKKGVQLITCYGFRRLRLPYRLSSPFTFGKQIGRVGPGWLP